MATSAASIATDERAVWRKRLWMALGVLLVVRLLALMLNRTDLFFDEAQYWTWSLEPSFGYYSKPPLIAWIIAASTSLCGSSEFCIRLPVPIIHTATAAAVAALAARLAPARPDAGFWTGLAFATLPGISFSSGIISTDVPLLLCWAVALWALVWLMQEEATWEPAIVLGLAIGIGLNAKYAMAYFVLCLAVFLIVTPERRGLVRDKRLWIALGLGVALILPNLIWNATHNFATFSHTADNAKWGGSLFNPGKALEFLGAQFGVMGPILFWVLLATAAQAIWRDKLAGVDETWRLLLAFSIPIILIVTVQAFISRAHANWAAPAYVAATVLVVPRLLQAASRPFLRASFAIHIGVLALLTLVLAFAGRFSLPVIGDPFVRTLGWAEVAATTRAKLNAARLMGTPFGAVITDDRALTAELLYYMRHEPTPVLAWLGGSRPQDHYELKRPFAKGSPEPVLLVALRPDSEPILKRFAKTERLVQEQVPAGQGRRRVTFFRLSGYLGN